jgi:hypothetical protein
MRAKMKLQPCTCIAGPSSGSTVGGNGVTTEISDQPPA